ncbi:MAG TPA: phenylacetate--CoA ligase [bacterium]|nr:phenylacetate--CoA ligase [bacterium]
MECLPRHELQALQLRRLQDLIRRADAQVPYYQRVFRDAGIHPEDIRSLDDLQRLPFTTKDDVRTYSMTEMMAVSMDRVVRLHASSGTTGHPTVVAYTRNDLDLWSDLVARIIRAGGVGPSDILQVAFGYGLFTGGFGLHYGAEKIGAAVIPASSGNTLRQIELMRAMKATALVCTPSYALHIADFLEKEGVKPGKDIHLRFGLFGGEPWSENMRREIEAGLGISATDNYGLSEIIGPGVSGECPVKNGLHISEDHFLAEVIDPDTGQSKAIGEEGELVLTALTKEALPVIRYRTRDICRLIPDPCSCGRTTVRMTKVQGRNDDMLIVRGVNVFPSQIEEILLEVEGVQPFYQIILGRKEALDTIEVQVEVRGEVFSDEMKGMRALEEKLRQRLHTALGISVKITLVEHRTLERAIGKSKRVIDNRNF